MPLGDSIWDRRIDTRIDNSSPTPSLVKYAVHVDSIAECAALCTQANYPASVSECRSFTYGSAFMTDAPGFTDLKKNVLITPGGYEEIEMECTDTVYHIGKKFVVDFNTINVKCAQACYNAPECKAYQY